MYQHDIWKERCSNDCFSPERVVRSKQKLFSLLAVFILVFSVHGIKAQTGDESGDEPGDGKSVNHQVEKDLSSKIPAKELGLPFTLASAAAEPASAVAEPISAAVAPATVLDPPANQNARPQSVPKLSDADYRKLIIGTFYRDDDQGVNQEVMDFYDGGRGTLVMRKAGIERLVSSSTVKHFVWLIENRHLKRWSLNEEELEKLTATTDGRKVNAILRERGDSLDGEILVFSDRNLTLAINNGEENWENARHPYCDPNGRLKGQIGSGVMLLLLTFGLNAGAWKLAGRRCKKRGVVKPSLRVTLWFFLRYVLIVTVFLMIIPSFLMESRQTFPIDASDLAYGAFVGLVSVLLFFTYIGINKNCPTQQSLFIIYISALVSLFVVLWFVVMFMGLLSAYD